MPRVRKSTPIKLIINVNPILLEFLFSMSASELPIFISKPMKFSSSSAYSSTLITKTCKPVSLKKKTSGTF